MAIPISYSIIHDHAPSEVDEMIGALIRKNYPDLVEANAKIGCVVKERRKDGEKVDGPCLKHHGYDCLVTIKVNSAKDRLEGKPDATITIDGNMWDGLRSDQQEALLDHELYHLIVKRDDDKKVKTDDQGRPLFKMRLHDHEFGWFDEIAKRYGGASQEVIQAQAFAEKSGQLYFGWIQPPDIAVESSKSSKSKTSKKALAEAVA
jgi:hypothetical protein